MIRRCDEKDFEAIWEIISEGAQAYRGVIPPDRWHEPFPRPQERRRESCPANIEAPDQTAFDSKDVTDGLL